MMELKFFRNPEEGDLSVNIIDEQNETDFDYIKFIDSLYKDRDSISAIFDDSVSEGEKEKINSMIDDIKMTLKDD